MCAGASAPISRTQAAADGIQPQGQHARVTLIAERDREHAAGRQRKSVRNGQYLHGKAEARRSSPVRRCSSAYLAQPAGCGHGQVLAGQNLTPLSSRHPGMNIRDDEHLRRMTDGIVANHARQRRRTRWAVGAGVAIAVAVAVPVVTVVNRSTISGRPAAGAATVPVAAATVPVAAAPQPVSDEAAVYAAVLIDWQASGPLQVHERICTSAEVCSAGRPTLALRRELFRRLGPRLQFTATAALAIDLQQITVHGRHATVRLKDSCGQRCFSGELVHLTRTGVTWRITGDRERWIT